MKRISISTAVIIALAAFITGSSGFAAYKYLSTDRSMVGKEADRLGSDPSLHLSQNDNVNVMMTRPSGWHQIASDKLLLRDDFAGIDGSTATIPITAELARQFCGASDSVSYSNTNNVGSYVKHNTTGTAYENLIFGRSNRIDTYDNINKKWDSIEKPVRLVFATPPSEDEYSTAKSNRVTLEAEPIALDGFVFITHKDNPVDSLSVQQIKDIYSGKITNWKEVGGRDEKIRAFQRTKNSGSQTAMEELVMQGEPMAEAPIAFVSAEMGELVESVAEYENESAAIGYTYYYYINNLYRNPDIKVINIDGVSPDNENLVDGSYPFTAAYYAVIRGDEPQDSVYRKVRDYMLSDEGQEIIRLAGYCPVKG